METEESRSPLAADQKALVATRLENQRLATELSNWKREWSDRFGFLADRHPHDSLESIDEVAAALGPLGPAAKLRDLLTKEEPPEGLIDMLCHRERGTIEHLGEDVWRWFRKQFED